MNVDDVAVQLRGQVRSQVQLGNGGARFATAVRPPNVTGGRWVLAARSRHLDTHERALATLKVDEQGDLVGVVE